MSMTPERTGGGFVLVPRDPNDAMFYAGGGCLGNDAGAIESAARVWRAMIAAAPAPVASPVDGDDLTSEQLAQWLDAKYARHREDEDRQAAAMLRHLAYRLATSEAFGEQCMRDIDSLTKADVEPRPGGECDPKDQTIALLSAQVRDLFTLCELQQRSEERAARLFTPTPPPVGREDGLPRVRAFHDAKTKAADALLQAHAIGGPARERAADEACRYLVNHFHDWMKPPTALSAEPRPGGDAYDEYFKHEFRELERAVVSLGVVLHFRDDGGFARAELASPTPVQPGPRLDAANAIRRAQGAQQAIGASDEMQAVFLRCCADVVKRHGDVLLAALSEQPARGEGAVAWLRHGATEVMHNVRLDEPDSGPWTPLYPPSALAAEYTRGRSDGFDAATPGGVPVGDDKVLVPREIVANYRESTLIPRHRRICDDALAASQHGNGPEQGVGS